MPGDVLLRQLEYLVAHELGMTAEGRRVLGWAHRILTTADDPPSMVTLLDVVRGVEP